MIYFDNAATTPVHPDVAAIIQESLLADFGNPSSTYALGRESRRLIEAARRTAAASIHAKPEDIIFTSGASESNNTAIIATALQLQSRGRHLITTAAEHHSVLHPMQYLETLGFEVTYLPVDEKGKVAAEDVQAAIRPDTILISVIFANNEVGTINPIAQIGRLAREHRILFHTDAVQAFGSEEIDVDALHIDLLSMTGHKIQAPKGVGFLFRRKELNLPHFIHGGSQENDHRAGTENVPYIRGLAKAIELTQAGKEETRRYKKELTGYFVGQLQQAGVEFEVNGDLREGIPHVVNLWLKGIRSDKFLIQCDLRGIMLSAGSACTAGSLEPSHVLEAMFGGNEERIHESVRISFGSQNTAAEIDTLTQLIIQLQNKPAEQNRF